MALSAGQRQRIGLARAFYGNPFLVVLDEPTSNLDSDGEDALTEAILSVRRRGGIVVVIAHRPKALDGVDHVLVVVDSSVNKVQHATGGIVAELRVRDGDRVKAGDILVRLDETQTLANATIITTSFDELLARQARLETERDNADQIVFPKALLERAPDSNSEASRAIAAERTLFDLRRQARSGQKAQLRERSAQLQDE